MIIALREPLLCHRYLDLLETAIDMARFGSSSHNSHIILSHIETTVAAHHTHLLHSRLGT
jgi:hypothetical protein